MKKRYLIMLAIATLLISSALAPVTYDWILSMTGRITSVEHQVAYMNGTLCASYAWGYIDNNTQTTSEPLNISNIGTLPLTLTLIPQDLVNITSLTLSWNYTGNTLQPDTYEIVELYATVEASDTSFGFDTIIRAEG